MDILAALRKADAKLFFSLDWLHRSDRVQLVPSVVQVGRRHRRLDSAGRSAVQNRTVVAAARFLGVGLPYFALAYRFEN